MKTYKKAKEDYGFRPFDFTISVESKQEFDYICEILRCGQKYTSDERVTAESLLRAFRQELK